MSPSLSINNLPCPRNYMYVWRIQALRPPPPPNQSPSPPGPWNLWRLTRRQTLSAARECLLGADSVYRLQTAIPMVHG